MGSITIVGTGWTEGQLTLDAIELLKSGAQIILHTDRCGCAAWLDAQGIPFTSLDRLYEECDDFDVHAELAARAVVEAAASRDVVYAVADVRDCSAVMLCKLAAGSVRVVVGPATEGALMALMSGEYRSVEASDWEVIHLSAHESCLLREVDTGELASEVKLRLMEVYPEETEIWMLCADSSPVRLPLYAMDRCGSYDHRTCILVPAQRDIMKLERYDFEHLVEIIRFLCSPNGCPWDRVQTHESLRPCIIEEAYEVIDAIDCGDTDHLYDELGDMLLQIVLHAEIARKHGEFDIMDVTSAICEKMIHRHTHVFGSDSASNASEVLGLWSKNKMSERGQRTVSEAMRDIPRAMPAMLRAAKIAKRASEVGLRDDDAGTALERTLERIKALGTAADVEAKLGEALAALSCYARLANVDPEIALNGACERFIERFEKAESELAAMGGFGSQTAETLREYWNLVKL